jgi:hypothetical protein
MDVNEMTTDLPRCAVPGCERFGFVPVPGDEAARRCGGHAAGDDDPEPPRGTREHVLWTLRAIAREVAAGAPF